MILEGARILVVEDMESIQKLLKHYLVTAGAEVEIAQNGLLGCNKIVMAESRDAPFDVVIMDMQMPVMDGYDATRALRKQGFTKPIIALTAHSQTEDRNQCLDCGCDDYYIKPIPGIVLIEVVHRLWKESLETVTEEITEKNVEEIAIEPK